MTSFRKKSETAANMVLPKAKDYARYSFMNLPLFTNEGQMWVDRFEFEGGAVKCDRPENEKPK